MNYKLFILPVGVFVSAVAGYFVYTNLSMKEGPSLATAAESKVYAQYGNGYNGGGRYGISEKADMLGMTSEELQNKLQTQTMLEIAQEKGFSQEEFQALTKDAAIKRWQDRGFSEEEIAERSKLMEERQSDCDGSGQFRGYSRR